jgi:hypothetical protein
MDSYAPFIKALRQLDNLPDMTVGQPFGAKLHTVNSDNRGK